MKLIKAWVFSLVILTFFFAFTGNHISAAAEVNSFELFWPIVAGKVQGESLYPLKIFKERVRGFFIFSDTKKAEYFSFLSTKRLVEYEKLVLAKKDYENAAKTLKVYEENLKKGRNLETFKKQFSLLEAILAKVEESQKSSVEKTIFFLNSRLEELR